jgi:hypothetical protein
LRPVLTRTPALQFWDFSSITDHKPWAVISAKIKDQLMFLRLPLGATKETPEKEAKEKAQEKKN